MTRCGSGLIGALAIGMLVATVLQPSSRGETQAGKTQLLRVPNRGIQPQAAVDGQGVVHLIYFAGDAKNGDIFYVRSEKGNDQWSKPIRVNSQPGSAIALGNIRGAHLALGKNGRVHVAWMGSEASKPKAPGNAAPMLYTRSNEAKSAFEPQRNVIQSAVGLDGGGSVAADGQGNVYVVWHAPEPGKNGEDQRKVWVANSTDDGKTFAKEKPAFAQPTGACGCCGMRAFADSKGAVYVLYRSATESVNRDIYLLVAQSKGSGFEGDKLHPWNVAVCPMSSMAFAESAGSVLAAWETKEQVYFTRIDATTGKRSAPIAAPGSPQKRKHPVVAGNSNGETILVWTEGMGWNQGGSVAWQVFDKDGQPTSEKGQASGVPVWSLVAVFAKPDGGFAIVY